MLLLHLRLLLSVIASYIYRILAQEADLPMTMYVRDVYEWEEEEGEEAFILLEEKTIDIAIVIGSCWFGKKKCQNLAKIGSYYVVFFLFTSSRPCFLLHITAVWSVSQSVGRLNLLLL